MVAVPVGRARGPAVRVPALPAVVVAALSVVAGCAGAGTREERTLRAALFDPLGSVAERGEELRAQMAAGETLRPGTRVAFVHHALRTGADVDAARLLTAEATAHPAAAAFLARYAEIMGLSPIPALSHPGPGRAVLVLPAVDQTNQPAVVADLVASLARPLLATGAWVVPIEVGLDLVARLGGEFTAFGRGAPTPILVQHLGAALGLDACFALQIVEWRAHAAFVVESVEHDVRYALIDAATGEARWRRTVAGTYVRREPLVTFSPYDEDPTFYYPSSHGAVFDDQFEFARALNRAALGPLAQLR